jgi:hypothetical protein
MTQCSRIIQCTITLILFAANLNGESKKSSQNEIDLSKIGYPARCDYLFQDSDHYAKRHIEFVDDEHLLVTFPLRSVPCDKYGQPPAEKYRSVIIDLTGKALSSFERLPGENIQAGPDKRLLMSSGWQIRLLDWNFATLQHIDWTSSQGPQSKLPRWTGRLILAPSRTGFLVTDGYPPNHTSYFEGMPAGQTSGVASCSLPAVTDGGFGCLEVNTEELHIHVGDSVREIRDPILFQARAAILPDSQTILILNEKYKLFLLGGPGGSREIADLRWLTPGAGSGFRWEMASAASQRIMFFGHGARVPITDSSGFGYYLRTAIVDVTSKRIVFRKQYPIDDDLAVSPNGQFLAVRNKSNLTLISLPEAEHSMHRDGSKVNSLPPPAASP